MTYFQIIGLTAYTTLMYGLIGALSAQHRDNAWSERGKPPYTNKERLLRFWLWPWYWTSGLVIMLIVLLWDMGMYAIGKDPTK